MLTRRRASLVAIAGFLISLAGWNPADAQQSKELRFGTPFVNGSNLHRGMLRFAEVVNAESKGKYKVLVYSDSQIGDIQALLSGMQLGTVDMAYLGIGNGASLKGGGPLNVAYTPYLFKSKEWAEKILNGPIFEPMFEELAKESGVRVFAAAGARSARAIQTTKGPINKPEDLKGMRLRIPPIPMFKDAFEALGVKVVPMGLSDVYLALSRNQVDGQDNGFDLSLSFKWHEVAKYWSATDHCYELATWYISEKLWQQMTPEDQALFKRAAKEGGIVATELGEEIDANGIEELKKANVTYVKPDIEPFRKAFESAHKAYEGKLWPAGLVDRIRAMQN
jgi:tripartite ATP-independent transporter DctP family solute receptor